MCCRRERKRVLQVMPWEGWSEISALAAAYGVSPHAVYKAGPRYDNVSMQDLYKVRSNFGPHCAVRAETTTKMTSASAKSSSRKLKSTLSSTPKWDPAQSSAAASLSSARHGNMSMHKATQTDGATYWSKRIL